MPTPMGMVFLKRQIKDPSPLGRGTTRSTLVKDHSISAIVAVNDYSNMDLCSLSSDSSEEEKEEAIDPKIEERLSKPFDLREARSFNHISNRHKLDHPINSTEWCHSIIQQRWFQCIGGPRGKLQMDAEHFLEYASKGLTYLENEGCSFNFKGCLLHALTVNILQEIQQAVQDPRTPALRYRVGKHAPPLIIIPEILDALPLDHWTRLRHHARLTEIWSEIPKDLQPTSPPPIWKPENALWRSSWKRATEKSLIKEIGHRMCINSIINTFHGISTRIYYDMESFYEDHCKAYTRSELAEIDAQCEKELDEQIADEAHEAQELRERADLEAQEELALQEQLAVEEQTEEISGTDSESDCSEDSNDSISVYSSPSSTPRTSPEPTPDSTFAFACASFDWADDVIEAAEAAETEEESNRPNTTQVFDFATTPKEQHNPDPANSIAHNANDIDGSKTETDKYPPVFEKGDAKEETYPRATFPHNKLQKFLKMARPTEDVLGQPWRLSAKAGFVPHLYIIWEQDEDEELPLTNLGDEKPDDKRSISHGDDEHDSKRQCKRQASDEPSTTVEGSQDNDGDDEAWFDAEEHIWFDAMEMQMEV